MIRALAGKHPNLFAFLFGCAVLALLWLLVECVSYSLLQKRAASAIQITKDEWQVDDERLGYRPKASYTGKEKKWRGDTVVYDVTYRFDALHRRVSKTTREPGQYALFFGDSFTFGQGVEDEETLPSQFAGAAPEFRPYNFGCGGYGPQNFFVQAQLEELWKDVRESGGIAVYTFIAPQVPRAIGSLRMLSLWGRRLPYLEETPGGLRPRGLYEEVFPRRCRAASLFMSSPTVRLLDVDWPGKPSPKHYAYVARILREGADLLAQQVPNLRFCVLLYPADKDPSGFIAALENAEVPFLDYTRLFQQRPAEAALALGDGHPTPAAYRIVAEALAADLAKIPAVE